MSDIVERLKAGICDDKCKIMNISGGCDCAIAAAEIERLLIVEAESVPAHIWQKEKARAEKFKDQVIDTCKRAEAAEARLAEAVKVLLDVNDAAQIDVLMEGPRLQGWRRSELDRLWPKLRAFLAKLEGR